MSSKANHKGVSPANARGNLNVSKAKNIDT